MADELDDADVELELARARARRKAPVAQPVREQPGTFDTRSQSGAALRGAGQGLSLGFADELSGLVGGGVGALSRAGVALLKTPLGRQAIRARLGAKANGLPDAAIDAITDSAADQSAFEVLGTKPRAQGGKGLEGATYSASRDAARSDNDEAERANPGTYGAAEFVGGIAAPVPGPGAAKPLQTIGNRMLQLAKYGAKVGALSSLGSSQADLTEGDVGNAAVDAALGAGTGAAGAAIIGTGMDVGPARLAKLTGLAKYADKPFIGPFIPEKTLAAKARDFGLDKLVKSVVPAAGLSNRLRNKLGLAGNSATDDGMRAFAEGIERGNFVRFGENASKSLQRVEDTLRGEGAGIGSYLDKADELAAQGIAKPASRDAQQMAVDRAMSRALDTPAAVKQGVPVWKDLVGLVGNDKQSIPGPATYRELWKNKSQLQKALKPNDTSELADDLYRKGVKGYTQGVYGQLESALGPDAIDGLRESADRYGVAAKVEDLLREKSSRQAQNASISLSDLQKAQLAQGAFKDIPMAGPAAALIASVLRPRVDPSLATGALALSRGLQRGSGAATGPTIRALLEEQQRERQKRQSKAP